MSKTTCQACGKVCHQNSWIDVQYKTAEINEYRTAIACNECLERMDADMWVRREHWEELKPIVPYSELPLYEDFHKGEK